MQELEESLKSKEQEIIRLKNIDKERVSKISDSLVLDLSETKLHWRSGHGIVIYTCICIALRLLLSCMASSIWLV